MMKVFSSVLQNSTQEILSVLDYSHKGFEVFRVLYCCCNVFINMLAMCKSHYMYVLAYATLRVTISVYFSLLEFT